MKVDLHPELDKSVMLNEKEHKHNQKIIGIGQWIITSGRSGMRYAVSSLNRFCAAPKGGHLKMPKYMLGYSKKYSKRPDYINRKSPQIIEKKCKCIIPNHNFGTQYHYFKEKSDSRLPELLVDELILSVFCDADHGHDKTTGRSISGVTVTDIAALGKILCVRVNATD